MICELRFPNKTTCFLDQKEANKERGVMSFLKQFRGICVTVLLASLCVTGSGCFYFVVGATAAGVYAVSGDTIQGELEKDFEAVWDASVEIVSILGTVNSQSHELGKILATVNGAKVTINVLQLASSATRLKVKARISFFPSRATAQNVCIKIMNRVNQR